MVTPHDLLLPTLDNTKEILKSARDHGRAIKRVIVTSVFTSIMDLEQGIRPVMCLHEKDLDVFQNTLS